jgi:hypothetical protein
MKVACHFHPQSRRSTHLAQAMAAGARAIGLTAAAVEGFDSPAGDVGIAYGWGRPELFDAYQAQGGHFAYLDLGWWGRKPKTNVLGGFHKIAIDAREPTAYFRGNFATDRFATHGLTAAPWRASGSHVLLAGMSAKSAKTRGFQPQEWEMATIEAIRAVTDRPIVYRPKPSWAEATPIPGTIFSFPDIPLEVALRDCWAAVTLHSNVAVDALLAGIPVNVAEGVARDFSTPLVHIETPRRPDDREQLMADIAYCQWLPAEMASGAAWRHLLEHTPICG